ncbi:MAG: SDR family NAD(P)-dependent oxidoreductase [Myxococcota bacterium]
MPNALVIGGLRGLGRAFSTLLSERGHRVFATSRTPDAASIDLPRVDPLRVDVTDEESIVSAVTAVGREVERLHLVINVAGVLHEGDLSPEKKLEDVQPARMTRSFAVNALGPLLVAKHVVPLLRHDERAVLANLSARVGSVGDNRLGGWYGYRASKAAQNMFTKNLSIELGRRARNVIVVALHPGTVDTDLSKPFQRNVRPGKLFTPRHSADKLLEVIASLGPDDSGGYFDYARTPIPW